MDSDTGGQAFAGGRPFTVLVVAVQWPPETFVMRTMQALTESGVQIQLCVSVRRGQRVPRNTGLQIVETPSWNLPVSWRAVTFLRLLVNKSLQCPRAVLRLVRMSFSNGGGMIARGMSLYRLLPFAGLRPDIVHFQWNTAAIEYEVLFDLFACPVVISCRGSQINVAPHNPQRRAIVEELSRTLSRAAAVHCVSAAIAEEAQQYGLEPEKAHVIRPAIDPDFFRPAEGARPTPDASLRIVTTGALGWVKGHEYALLAVRRLQDSGVAAQFDIIGDGPERQRMLYTIYDLELQEAVRLRGKLSPEQVRDVLQQADVFLLSSLSEGIANAALEAMACGLPIVTTDCGGMREAVTDGVEGFVVPVRDAEAMACALRCLAVDANQRRQMGRAARQRILSEFTLEQQKMKFLRLYTDLLSSP